MLPATMKEERASPFYIDEKDGCTAARTTAMDTVVPLRCGGTHRKKKTSQTDQYIIILSSKTK